MYKFYENTHICVIKNILCIYFFKPLNMVIVSPKNLFCMGAGTDGGNKKGAPRCFLRDAPMKSLDYMRLVSVRPVSVPESDLYVSCALLL